MTIASALQGVIVLQVISKTVSQFPMPFPFPGGPPGAAPMNMAPMPPPFLPGGMGGPMNFPPQHKMPMVVMPYYSKSIDKAHSKIRRKKRKPKIHYDDSSCEDDESTSSSDEIDYRTKSKSKRRQVLTPVVSYVTKDGYVIYQKKIKKDKAKDWLEMNKRAGESQEIEEGYDEKARLLKKLRKLKFKRRHSNQH